MPDVFGGGGGGGGRVGVVAVELATARGGSYGQTCVSRA